MEKFYASEKTNNKDSDQINGYVVHHEVWHVVVEVNLFFGNHKIRIAQLHIASDDTSHDTLLVLARDAKTSSS